MVSQGSQLAPRNPYLQILGLELQMGCHAYQALYLGPWGVSHLGNTTATAPGALF